MVYIGIGASDSALGSRLGLIIAIVLCMNDYFRGELGASHPTKPLANLELQLADLHACVDTQICKSSDFGEPSCNLQICLPVACKFVFVWTLYYNTNTSIKVSQSNAIL